MKNQEKNENLQFSNQYNIQWFPGHMARTLRVMEQEIQHVDASLILLDARIPLSSLNPEIERITARKPRLYVMNKADLADPAVTARWKRWFENQGAGCVAISSKNAARASQLAATLKDDPRFEYYAFQFSESPTASNGGKLTFFNVLNAFPLHIERRTAQQRSNSKQNVYNKRIMSHK